MNTKHHDAAGTGLRASRKTTATMILRQCICIASLATSIIIPAHAGFPFLTDDPGTQGTGHVEADLYVQWSGFRAGGAGSIPAVQLNYGIADNLDLAMTVPYAVTYTKGIGTNTGIGDVQVGFKLRLIQEDTNGWRPAIGIAPSVLLPSGSAKRGLGAGYVRAFLPVWASKTLGEWSVFGGGGININQARIQGIRQQDWVLAGLGVTYRINEKWTVGAEVFYNTPVTTQAKHIGGFNAAAIYNINEIHSLMALAGRNLVNARDTDEFFGLLAYQLRF